MRSVPVLNVVVEFGPIAVFFIAFQATGDFFAAAIALVVSTIGAVVAATLIEGRIPIFPLICALPVVCFGFPSIVSENADLFIFRESVADFLFGLALLLSLATRYPLLKTFFDATLSVTDRAWRIVTLRWGLFYLALSGVNEIVRVTYTDEVWVYYKIVTVVCTLIFALIQLPLFKRERTPTGTNAYGFRTSVPQLAHTQVVPLAIPQRAIVEE